METGDTCGEELSDIVRGELMHEPVPEGGEEAKGVPGAAEESGDESSESVLTFSNGWNQELEHSACGGQQNEVDGLTSAKGEHAHGCESGRGRGSGAYRRRGREAPCRLAAATARGALEEAR